MTQTSHHTEQSKKNSYAVDKYTLRLIGTLAGHIDSMNHAATHFRTPVLVLHGGQDYFNNDSDMRGFVARVPTSAPVTYHNYPKAYHLLMYDAEKDKIFKDIEKWLNQLRRNPRKSE
jgi:alpha-beta hydrolase superfamily lysophospholipase